MKKQMRARKSFSSALFFLILGIGIPSFVGLMGAQAKTVFDEPVLISSNLQIGSTSTYTPTSLSGSSTSFSPSSTSLVVSTSSSSTPLKLYAFIQAPTGPVTRPFVILTAFASIPRTTSVVIRGFVNTQEFICTQSPCAIYLQNSSRFVFRAYADTGESSDEVIASVNVVQGQNGFSVNIDSVNQFTTFSDSCAQTWGVEDEIGSQWDNFVQFPYQLNTKKTLHVLATKLILNGIVDTSGCAAGGLSVGLDWPTACGLERASGAMIEWQNQYDEYIWISSKEQGIPPKVVKTLIEIESQFWPGNERFYVDEYGLGQINQLGVDVLLRRDPTLYQNVCSGLNLDCLRPYVSLEPQQQAQVRGAVVSLADASCANCPYGLDLGKAKESVSLISMLLKANCQQVDVMLGTNLEDATYDDLWRFTLASYHSGISCFQDAVKATRKDKLPVTWENLGERLNCSGGKDYVNGFMDRLSSFDLYLYQPSDAQAVIAAATIVPTRTPVPTPTVYISSAQVKVQVFMDRNGNGSPDADEWIDAMTVLLTTSSNEQVTQRTQNGIAIFDMSGYTPGINVTVSLPGLYRSESFVLPEQGEISVTFMFEQPALPTILP